MRQVDGELLMDELGIDHLKDAAAFVALSGEAIAYLMKEGRIHGLRKGETLIKAGRPSGSFFVVLKGSLAYYQLVNNPSEHMHNFHFGEEIGFVTMIALTPWPGTAIAASDSQVLEVNSNLFYTFHCEMPLDFGVLLINLSRELARRDPGSHPEGGGIEKCQALRVPVIPVHRASDGHRGSLFLAEIDRLLQEPGKL